MDPKCKTPAVPHCRFTIKSFAIKQKSHLQNVTLTGSRTILEVHHHQQPSISIMCKESRIEIQLDVPHNQGCFISKASACMLSGDSTSQNLARVRPCQGIATNRPHCFAFEPPMAGSYYCEISYTISYTESLQIQSLTSVCHFTLLPCRDVMRDGECPSQEFRKE